jgi:hypothetical protein
MAKFEDIGEGSKMRVRASSVLTETLQFLLTFELELLLGINLRDINKYRNCPIPDK